MKNDLVNLLRGGRRIGIAMAWWSVCGLCRGLSAPARAEDAALLKLAFFGTNAPAGTVVLFGHGFARGALRPGDAVALREAGAHQALPIQMNPVTTWEDGSVKVAIFAAALPAVPQDEVMEGVLVKASPSPASPLDLQQALRGRSASLTLWRTGGGAPWTFDFVRAALAPQNKDRWHDGPLAVSTRVSTNVPAEAVGVTSLRLVGDLTVTRDGLLELDTWLANDIVMRPGGGPATYAYKVEIDGEEMFSQPESTHLQYTAWVRHHRRARNGKTPTPPWVRPDYDALVRAGFTLPWDRSLPSSFFSPYITRSIRDGLAKPHPYPNWGLNRSAGAAGGRQEIGYRTYANMIWLKSGHPEAQFLAHRQLETAMSRPQNFWDDELGTWLNPEDWPQFTSGVPSQNFSPAGTPREKARGFPPEQRPTANDREHMTIDHAHNGEYFGVPAVLSGRRIAFDGLAMNAAWQTIDANSRNQPLPLTQHSSWRNYKPDHLTGFAWAPRPGAPQIRGFAWGLRDVAQAAALLPDAYPRREFYTRNVLAWINSYAVHLDRFKAERGELAGWIPHTDGRRFASGFMTSFVVYALLDAIHLGVSGPNGQAFLEYVAGFRINSFTSPDFNWRNAATGKGIHVGDGQRLFTRWAEAQASHVQAKDDMNAQWNSTGPGEGDWQRNVLAGLALMRDAPLPLAMRVKAADAMVLFRSERPVGPGGHPRITPEAFFGPFENLNSLCPHGSTWRWDVPPRVREGQVFRLADRTPEGFVGLILTDGGLPRASKPEGLDAFVIVEQPAGNPFEMTRGGGLRLVRPPRVWPAKLRVYATTYDNDGREHRGPTVEVTVVER